MSYNPFACVRAFFLRRQSEKCVFLPLWVTWDLPPIGDVYGGSLSPYLRDTLVGRTS